MDRSTTTLDGAVRRNTALCYAYPWNESPTTAKVVDADLTDTDLAGTSVADAVRSHTD